MARVTVEHLDPRRAQFCLIRRNRALTFLFWKPDATTVLTPGTCCHSRLNRSKKKDFHTDVHHKNELFHTQAHILPSASVTPTASQTGTAPANRSRYISFSFATNQ
ncbi:hypothetical protein J6590_083563, partial [Homalodisca vitripennis]